MMFFSCVVALGISLVLRANIGACPLDALYFTLSQIFKMKVGTFIICMNSILILCQILLLGKEFKKSQYLQFVNLFVFGNIINFFYGTVFVSSFDFYLGKVAMFAAGIVLTALGVGVIINLNIIDPPFEGFVKAICHKLDLDFVKYRLVADFVCAGLALVLIYTFNTPQVLREGTLLGLLMFTAGMGIFIRLTKPLLSACHLLED